MERTFYWHFVVSLRNLRLAFLPKCIISAKFFLSKFFWSFRFYGPKNTLVFCFSFFHFDNFLTTFSKDLIKKPSFAIMNIKSTHIFLHFHKDLRSRIICQWNDGPLKTLWKLHGNGFSLQISGTFRKFETCLYIEIRNFF